ncbi:5063_t:CDS:10, partial [Funneliformis geosporum]
AMAKVWHDYFNKTDVEAWSILHFQQNWERIHEGDYKPLSYDKATDALTKSLFAIINKSLDTKKIKKANSLLTTLQNKQAIANVKRMLRRNMNSKNIDTGNYLQFSSCSDVRIESVSTAEGSASYVKDTLSSSSLETVAETESAGSNSPGHLEKEDDDQSLFSVDDDGPSMPTDESSGYDANYGDLSPSEIAKEQYVSEKFNPIAIQNNSSGISSLISIMVKYCEKNTTSKFDPANSYILDLSSKSTIAKEFTPECWSKLIADCPNVVTVEYHKELDVIFEYLFGKQIKNVQQARVQWENLRSIKAPEYKSEFSYGIDEWKKILWWIEWAVGRFLNAFETKRNPLLQNNCHEREFLGGYLVPIFQGALALDGRFRVSWGEVTVQASMQRRNNNKIILEEKVDRGHLTDLLCSTESYEMLCLLACGGPHKVDFTKLASDEFNLPRLLKDTLDDIREKYNKENKSCLYTIGLQQYKSEVRVYLMELRDVYRLHHLKTLYLPLTFSTYRNLRVSLSWAWNIRGLVNDLLEKLIDDCEEIGSVTPQHYSNNMNTSDSPSKTKKKKIQ